MGANLAAQRGRKAARRKQVLAERRRFEVVPSPAAGLVARAAVAPIQHCLMPTSFADAGIGTIVVARGYSSGLVTAAFFMADTFALGVKDVFLRAMDGDEFEVAMDGIDATTSLVASDPALVRKFLHDLVAWSRAIGFEPAKEYALIEQIFGDVDRASSDATFTFGIGGRPLYVSGPKETAQIARRQEIIVAYNKREALPPPIEGSFEA